MNKISKNIIIFYESGVFKNEERYFLIFILKENF